MPWPNICGLDHRLDGSVLARCETVYIWPPTPQRIDNSLRKLLSFFLVFTNIAFLYLYPLALDAMGSGHHMIGLVMGLFSVAAVLSRPFLGKLVALKGEFRIIFFGMAVSLVASLCYNLITAFGPGMLLTRVIHGIGFSAFISGGFSLAAKAFHPEKRAEAFGVLGAALMAAVALAPILGVCRIHGCYTTIPVPAEKRKIPCKISSTFKKPVVPFSLDFHAHLRPLPVNRSQFPRPDCNWKRSLQRPFLFCFIFRGDPCSSHHGKTY
ncbi:MAG: MFS transporter [Deltaproteobacteria bacterium]|nr:MFS transporter [Deltaproteobacteria bacterium]